MSVNWFLEIKELHPRIVYEKKIFCETRKLRLIDKIENNHRGRLQKQMFKCNRKCNYSMQSQFVECYQYPFIVSGLSYRT